MSSWHSWHQLVLVLFFVGAQPIIPSTMPGPPENRFNMYLDKATKERLRRAADHKGVSMAEYAKSAIVARLNIEGWRAKAKMGVK